MLQYPRIDPVAFSIGPLDVRWYGLTYLAGFAFAWWYGLRRASRVGFAREEVYDLIFYAMIGVIIGGRLGYVLFYGFERLIADPLYLFAIREGGMSFHGGLLGVVAAMLYFARRTGRRFFEVSDFTAPLVPVGLGLGRIGNFLNMELPGRVTDVPWALVYPGEAVGRHPSPLYQAFAEGVVLFAAVWLFIRHPRPVGAVTGVFVAGYGVVRFTTEFFRAPDPHLGFIAWGWLTMGQLLSFPMILLGVGLVAWAYARNLPTPATKQGG